MAVSVTGGAGIDRGTAAEPTGPLEKLGQLQSPSKDWRSSVQPLAIDPKRHRLFGEYSYPDQGGTNGAGTIIGVNPKALAIYDLTSPVPKLVGTRVFQLEKPMTGSPFNTTVASDRNRLYSLVSGHAVEDGAIAAMDFEVDPMVVQVWDLATRLPGFVAAGLTYAPEDDRLYAVGEMAVAHHGLNPILPHLKVTGMVPTVAAFDPGDGSLLWARMVPECGQVLTSYLFGATIGRSSSAISPRLVFGCSTNSSGQGETRPGQAGVVELHITPTAGPTEAQVFDVSFHPVSGSFFNGAAFGFAVFDPGSDRLFVQSLSRITPGAWVFDGRLGGWAGFITAPSTGFKGQAVNVSYGGIHPGNGHYYMGGSDGGEGGGTFVVADGRASPPQNGVFGAPPFVPHGFILGDPLSDRLFIPKGLGAEGLVARDLTRSADLLERPDYDAQTDDIGETPGTFVSFSGDTGGFGARVTAIGDTSAASGAIPLWGTLTSEIVPGATRPVGVPTNGPVSSATRGLLFARVPTANVQPAGAAASAQAMSSDTTTGQAVDETGVTWPYELRTCLDGGEGGETAPAESVGGRAEVHCDLTHYEATGSARQAGAGTGPVSIGDTRVDTRVKRTAKGGMTNTTTSLATGIRVEVPGVGTLEIGKVETVATTTAHGRSGTATAEWTRKVADVTVTVAGERYGMAGCTETVRHDGSKRTRSGDGGACDALAEAVRRLLQVRVRLLFPTPSVDATPRGAFARVSQTERDAAREVTVSDQGKVFPNDATTRRSVPGLQIDVYNDSTERSRYIVQLAGVENSSIYTVNRSADDAPCDMGGCIPGGSDEPPSLDSGDPASSSGGSLETAAAPLDDAAPVSGMAMPPAVGGSGRRPSSSDGRSGLEGLILARRSLGDGGLMASFLVLVAAAVGAVARRRRLLSGLAA